MTNKILKYLGIRKATGVRSKALAHYAPSHYTSPKAYGEMLAKRKKTSC